jgi:Cd(II)/Pb(II)-responsive transcriptional regulator
VLATLVVGFLGIETRMKIGELSRATGTPVESIRYYERAGLMPKPSRTSANYRAYAHDHLLRLAFIRRCRSLGMSLDEIRVLLHHQDQPAQGCSPVNVLLDEHIGHVAQRIEDLQDLQAQLVALRARCDAVPSALGLSCGIMDALNRAPSGSACVSADCIATANVHALQQDQVR